MKFAALVQHGQQFGYSGSDKAISPVLLVGFSIWDLDQKVGFCTFLFFVTFFCGFYPSLSKGSIKYAFILSSAVVCYTADMSGVQLAGYLQAHAAWGCESRFG